jgi:hypothetical protein
VLVRFRYAQRGLAHLASGGVLLMLAAVTAAGCRAAEPEPGAAAKPAVDVSWTLRPAPPVVGPATLAITLRAGGQPIDDATVRVVGLMTHPGMAPLPVQTMARGGGLYDGVFSFTMAGDWALVVTVQLADGRRLEQRVDVPGVRAAG